MRNDFILHKKGSVPEEGCKSIIRFFESHPEMHIAGTVGGRDDPEGEMKRDTEIPLDFKQPPHTFRWVLEYLERCLDEYRERYPFLDKTTAPWGLFSRYKLQRYYPGEGYFNIHCENTGPNPNERPIDHRVLAWMIYLNDVKDGGHTSFPSQKRKFQPRRGDVLLWPAYFTHPHHGITSKTQTKYIVTGWYNFYPVEYCDEM